VCLSFYLSYFLSLSLFLPLSASFFLGLSVYFQVTFPILLCETFDLWISFIPPFATFTQLTDLKLKVLNCLQSELEEHLSKKWPLIFLKKKVLFAHPTHTLLFAPSHTQADIRKEKEEKERKREREKARVKNMQDTNWLVILVIIF
jgi:hypothetical protein